MKAFFRGESCAILRGTWTAEVARIVPRIHRRRFPAKSLIPFFFLILSVISSPPAFPVGESSIPQEEREKFLGAKQLYDQGDYTGAINALQEFLRNYPKSNSVPQVFFLLGQSQLQRGSYLEAVEPLKYVVEGFPELPFAGEARLQLARAYLQLGMLDRAVPVLEREAAVNPEPQTRVDLYSQIADLYITSGEGLSAINTLLKQREVARGAEDRLGSEERIRQVIEHYLDGQQLQALFERYPQSFPGDAALLHFAESSYMKGEFFQAERALTRFLGRFPNHGSRPRAKELLATLRSAIMSLQFRLGVLLPLTGPQAPYAESVLKGLQVAIENVQKDLPEGFVGLVIRDYEGKTATLKASLKELVEDYGSIAVIGPLLSRDVELVAPVVERYQVPLMTPTATAQTVMKDHGFVFRNTVTPEVVGKTLAEYALLRAGLTRFVILYPGDSYGLEMMKIFSEEVNRLGGEIIAAEEYPPGATDFGKEIRRVIDLDLKRYGAVRLPPAAGPGPRLEYIPGFDAVFLPGDPLKTGMLAAQLAFHEIKDRTLLVTHAANSPEFLSAGNRFVEGAILADGFFEGSSDPTVRSFVARYYAKYQESPNLFAAQAYDSVLMILHALKSGARSPQEIRDYLARIKEFRGVSGITAFQPTGQAEKRLFIIQVQKGMFVQVN